MRLLTVAETGHIVFVIVALHLAAVAYPFLAIFATIAFAPAEEGRLVIKPGALKNSLIGSAAFIAAGVAGFWVWLLLLGLWRFA